MKKFISYILLISWTVVSISVVKVYHFSRWLFPTWRDWLDLFLSLSLVGIFIILTGFVMAALS